MLSVFFFNDTATTEIYTLSLHDALPIWSAHPVVDHACSSLAGHTSLGRVPPPGSPGRVSLACAVPSGDPSSSLRPGPAPRTGVPRRWSAPPEAILTGAGRGPNPLSTRGWGAEATTCRGAGGLTRK